MHNCAENFVVLWFEEFPLRSLCVLCASAVNRFNFSIYRGGAEKRRGYAEEIGN